MRWVVALVWILGAGSLACFGVFLWTGGFGIVELRLAHGPMLAFDAALCLLFFLQHSILVRRSVRNSLRKVIPEYCYGLSYTITSSIALLTLLLLWQRSPVYLYALHGAGSWIARCVLLLTFLWVLWGIRTLERFDAFGVQVFLAQIRGKHTPPARLTVRGPFRLVRHPFYTCVIVALWATPLLSLDRILCNVLFTGWILLGALLEERDLLAEFGEEYESYRRTIPMFVPQARKWRTNSASDASATSAGRTG